MEEDIILISKDLLAGLIRDRQKLLFLEYAGVDNWDGYDKALEESVEEGFSFKKIQVMTDDEVIEKYF